jgi:hypothetical protein
LADCIHWQLLMMDLVFFQQAELLPALITSTATATKEQK